MRPQGVISAAGADACETDMGRFRPVVSDAAGLDLAAAACLAEGLGTDFGPTDEEVGNKFGRSVGEASRKTEGLTSIGDATAGP